jgi:N-acetylmuramoyl-L-alanine amidase
MGAVVLLLALPAVVAHARSHKSADWASSQFATAERMREALNGLPTQQRSRSEYQRVVNAYRRVYFGSPTSSKAAVAVAAEAEVMVEMGRRLHDDSILHKAIHKYEFLRREYPGSGDRFQALFTIGEIYKDDLNDNDNAQEVFNEFLRRYPRNRLADDARQALDGIKQAALAPKDNTQSGEAAKDDAAKSDEPARVTGIRYWSSPEYTRIAIDLEQDVKFESQRIDNPDRIYFDLMGTKLASTLVGKSFDVNDGFLKQIRIGQFQPDRTRVVLDVDNLSDYDSFFLSDPARLVIDVHGKQTAKAPAADDKPNSADTAKSSKAEENIGPKKVVVEADDDDATAKVETASVKTENSPETTGKSSRRKVTTARGKRRAATEPDVIAREAQPTANGDRSLIRALGLKIGKIVIDPGHGGHDTGTIGPNGLMEKDLVLDVGRRLGKLLETRLGADVVFTRSDDTFVPLETRTAIANQEQADLFVSIHANASSDPDARGVETYYLNFTSSADALEVAARENAVSDKSIHELQDLVKKIALKEKIDESREFASDVQESLHTGLASKSPGIRDRGVKKAPFIVLIGANMPSILAEISFVSNPTDERRLRTSDYRQRIAESLYRGISKYVSGLSGVKVAAKVDKGEGQ